MLEVRCSGRKWRSQAPPRAPFASWVRSNRQRYTPDRTTARGGESRSLNDTQLEKTGTVWGHTVRNYPQVRYGGIPAILLLKGVPSSREQLVTSKGAHVSTARRVVTAIYSEGAQK